MAMFVKLYNIIKLYNFVKLYKIIENDSSESKKVNF